MYSVKQPSGPGLHEILVSSSKPVTLPPEIQVAKLVIEPNTNIDDDEQAYSKKSPFVTGFSNNIDSGTLVKKAPQIVY